MFNAYSNENRCLVNEDSITTNVQLIFNEELYNTVIINDDSVCVCALSAEVGCKPLEQTSVEQISDLLAGVKKERPRAGIRLRNEE